MLTLRLISQLLKVDLEWVRDAGGQLFGIADPERKVTFEAAGAIRRLIERWGVKTA
jgi:hypothetical protein